MAQVVECLPSKCETLSSNSSTAKKKECTLSRMMTYCAALLHLPERWILPLCSVSMWYTLPVHSHRLAILVTDLLLQYCSICVQVTFLHSLMQCHNAYISHLTSSHHASIVSAHIIPRGV
jgi:hypothetical protein